MGWRSTSTDPFVCGFRLHWIYFELINPQAIQIDPRWDSQTTFSTTRVFITCATHDAFPSVPEGYGPARKDVQIVTRSGRIAQPPPIDRPFVGAATKEELQREDEEILH